jgi:putative endonuclease
MRRTPSSTPAPVILNAEPREAEGSAVVLSCPGTLPTAQEVLMHEGGYWTYIMASRSHTLYIGVTGNLQERVFQHKWREHDGFTARYNCDRLVWFERHQEVQRAIAREKELKGWRREKKIALIEAANPAWEDLSREWYDLEPADYRRALDRMDS